MSFWRELKQRSVVRVTALYLAAAWLVLQIADLVLEAFAFPLWSMRFLILLLVAGLPAVAALAWLYEWTPNGIRKEGERGAPESRRADGRKITVSIAILVVLASAIFALRPRLISQPDTATDVAAFDAPLKSIAVMPFVNVSDEPDNDYFSDGLSSELLNLLADVPELRVMARSASFYYKGKTVEPRNIGEELNVSHILEGEVRKAGPQLRISVRLINTETNEQVWSDSFDRTIDDVFAMQNEIAETTVDKLRVTLLGEPPRSRETDPSAYEAFLTGQYFYSQRTLDGYAKAVEYLIRATEIDPTFAPAWTTLSSAYLNQVVIGVLPYREGHESAIEAIETALQLDPEFAMANSARGWVAMTYERDYGASAAFFDKALRTTQGNSAIIGNSAILAMEIGLLDRSIDLTNQAILLNPISSVSYANLAGHLNRAGRTSEAIEAARKSLELTPGSVTAAANLGLAYLLSEQPERAREQADSVPREAYRLYLQSLANHSLGRHEQSTSALTALEQGYANRNGFEIACVYAWRGEVDRSFDWLDRTINEAQSSFGLKTEALLRNLHDDPRWDAVLRRRGLSDAQLDGLTI